LASGAVPSVLWVVLYAGAVATIGYTLFFGTENVRVQALMTGILSLLIFSALLVIVAVDHPYAGPVRLPPEALLAVLEDFGAKPQPWLLANGVCLGRWRRRDSRFSAHGGHGCDYDGDIAKQQSGEHQASHRNTARFPEELIRFWPAARLSGLLICIVIALLCEWSRGLPQPKPLSGIRSEEEDEREVHREAERDLKRWVRVPHGRYS
jgi:hypothetical protein